MELQTVTPTKLKTLYRSLSYVPALGEWVRQLEYAHQCLDETVAGFSDVVIDDDGTGARLRLLHQVEQTLTHAMPQLGALRRKALEEALPAPDERGELDFYWQVAERHAVLERRLAEFRPRPRASVAGVGTVLDAYMRNSIVLLTGRAATLAGDPVGEPVSARYFVARRAPRRLIYHVGYSYGRLKDIDFAQVRAASGQDLFAATATSASAAATAPASHSGEALALMSYEFWKGGANDRFGASATIGTGLELPGKSLYYGVSFRFRRALVSGGFATATATRGEGEVTDTMGTTSRPLFSAIRDVKDVTGFFAVSFRVY